MMSDREFLELELRMMIVPHQARWPAPELLHWRKLHEAANEARARVSKFYTLADEIDRKAGLSRDDKYRQRSKTADEAIADFEASRTLARAREAVRHDASPDTQKALEQAEVGWNRAMDKIAERASLTKGPDTRR
jgi:hypothetical protein